ncbi:MAG: hypothetical protein HQL31_07080 [Planctomycetes bacterium]|nr:hypothetical protein [Planctomycetota bacterium]
MTLLIFTVAVAALLVYSLFKVYFLALAFFLRKMNWKLEELKDYPLTPGMKLWDQFINLAIICFVIWKLSST